MQRPHVLIVGVGRSGTNWLFDLLDLSPATHCRNATQHSVPDSPLAPLISGIEPLEPSPELGARWDAAIEAMATRMGERDGRLLARKAHLNPLAQRLGLARLLASRRARQALGVVSPSLRRAEWPVPGWLASPASLASALPVLRTGGSLPCVAWVLANRPNARVLHMVRHPGGFTNSWKRRYLGEGDAGEIRRANLARLAEVSRVAPHWADRFGALEALSTEEAELWFWRYATESTWEAGRRHRAYKCVTFESLAADLPGTLRDVYAHCGLALPGSVLAAAERMPSRFSGKAEAAGEIAAAWRRKLDPADVERVDHVLEGSPIRGLWG